MTIDRLDQARSQFFEGLDCFEAARFTDAEHHFMAALALAPGRVSTQVNLAATLLKLSLPSEALGYAERVLEIEPDNADAQLHRASALHALGRHAEALASYERLPPALADNLIVRLSRAEILHRLNKTTEALVAYDEALAIDPTLAGAWASRGGILRESGRLAEAAAAFRQAIAHGDDSPLNRYYLASVETTAAPSAAPALYVEALFDDYAAQFDIHLVDVLGYRAHNVLARHLAPWVERFGRRFSAAVDLGCGTGLCGALLAPFTDTLIGVDLSTQMMAKARALDVYDELVHADIATFLATTNHRFDLIAAADVLIYTGDLGPIFEAAHRAMLTEVSSVFCFSVERVPDDGIGFRLMPSLRYGHSERHVRQLAARHGFEVLRIWEEPIREDQRESVPGLYVYLAPR